MKIKELIEKLKQFDPETLVVVNGLEPTKAKYYQNLTTESGSKQKCSLLQEKKSHLGSVPEDSGSWHKSRVLDLKGGLRVFRKTQIISTASEYYFLSYVKKIASSPAGIELKCLYKTVCLTP